jgi:hypothetical protein
MKKLLAILVITVFAATAMIAVDNPFTFSFYNQIKLKAVDQSQPGKIHVNSGQRAKESKIGDSPTNDYLVTKSAINDEMKGDASITIAEIYTMGFYLKGVGEFGFGGDSSRVEFSTGMTNSIKVVEDYLTIGINADWIIRWDARDAYFSEADNNTDLNGDGDTADEFDHAFGSGVDYLLKPSISLSGSVPDTGISWGLSETVEMQFDPDMWKDTDPSLSTYDGAGYSSTTGKANQSEAGLFNYAKFETKVTFDFEFFHFFAPENITGTLKLMNNFKVKLPYSYYLEMDKEVNNETEIGFALGLAGVSLTIAGFAETADFLNTSAPLNGDPGSARDWSGDFIGVTGAWDDAYAISHSRPNLKMGPKVNFSYTKEWFSFGTEYKGYEDGLRKWAEDGKNEVLKWVNEFSIYAKFAL